MASEGECEAVREEAPKGPLSDSLSLRPRLRSVRRRLLLIGGTSGVLWGSAAVLVLLVVGAWLDLLWELPPELRVGVLSLAFGAGAVFVGTLVWMTARTAHDAAIARRLDRTLRSGGDILTGLELDGPLHSAYTAHAPGLTTGLAEIAVGHAARLAGQVPASRAVPVKPLGRSLSALLLMVAALGLLALALPELVRTQWNRFVSPLADVPPYSQVVFEVKPGNTSVIYGKELPIHVTTRGAPVENVELVLEGDDGSQEVLPMFPEPDGRWRTVLAKVTAPATYYARAYRARSERYQIQLITVPRIETVRMRIVPPAYTNLPAYEGPMPKEGLSGLRGTKVQVWAASNRPLSGGQITLTGKGDPIEVPMTPIAEASQEVVGQFEITRDGKFQLHVFDIGVDRQSSQEPFVGMITLLADERPFIRLTQPPATSLATPSASLPVVLSAEDDYGISRVQLFRSLNDSRPLPLDVRLPKKTPRRAYETVYLPLARYGLEPGDTIKLFGRVEDNDPAGAKGAESTLVTVRIISQEEFERMLRIRQGLKVLLSKYSAARRRMESVANESEGLRKKLEKLPPGAPVPEELRQLLQGMLQRLRKESEALRQSAGSKLPYDVDKNLTPQLEKLAKALEEAAKQLEDLERDKSLSNARLAEQLKKMAERLGAGKKDFDKKAMVPVEHLAAVFPLIADQSRYVVLTARQRDLAERLASLKGRDGEDNPALKARMRELEEEQQQIRADLTSLLGDIEDHVERLPDEPQFDRLRQTAAKFVKEVRASGAAEAMSAAEAGLAEFSGTRGHEKAKEAADILERFIKKCSGMGGEAGACLVFQPSIGGCLGDTVS